MKLNLDVHRSCTSSATRGTTSRNSWRSSSPSRTQLFGLKLFPSHTTKKRSTEKRYDTRGSDGILRNRDYVARKGTASGLAMCRGHGISPPSCRESVGDVAACVRVISSCQTQCGCCVSLASGSGVSTAAASSATLVSIARWLVVTSCLFLQLCTRALVWHRPEARSRRCTWRPRGSGAGFCAGMGFEAAVADVTGMTGWICRSTQHSTFWTNISIMCSCPLLLGQKFASGRFSWHLRRHRDERGHT